jgi:hypothetical protein
MKNIIILIFVVVPFWGFSQNVETKGKIPAVSLNQRLQNIKKYSEICRIAESYYDSISKKYLLLHPEDMKYKHWKRHQWYISQRLDQNGNICNYAKKNLEANNVLQREEGKNSRSTNSQWEFNGPTGHVSPPQSYNYIGKGRTDRIAFHPTDPNIVLVGTPAGGVWKSYDGGNNFYCTTHNFPSLGVSGIAFSKTNPNLVYMLTGCAVGGGVLYSTGVYKSYDAGDTWFPTGNISNQDFSGYELTVSDIDENKVYIATTIGLYRTTNGGTTWSLVNSGLKYDVKFKPNSNTVYAVNGTTFFKITDNGASYSWIPQYISSFGRKGIGVSPADPNRVYVLSGPTTGVGTFNGLFMSIDSGTSFNPQSNTPNIFGGEGGLDDFHQSFYDFCITVSPSNADLVVMGGLVINKSLNSGVNWTSITTYGANSTSSSYVHPDIHDVEFNPHTGDLFSANDGGFYKTSDLGNTWTNLSGSIHTTQFYHIAGYRNNLNYFAGGCQDNGTKFRNTNSLLMDHVAGTDGFQTMFNPNDSTKFYCSFNGAVRRFYNNGASSDDISPTNNWFHKIGTHITNSNIIFVGDTVLFKSLNQGTTYTTYNNYPANQSIEMCKSNSNRLYVSGTTSTGIHKMHRLDALGDAFTRIDLSAGFPTSDFITDISVHPILDNFVYISVGGFTATEKIFFSNNGGASWSNFTFNLPNTPVLSIEVSSNNEVYIGTDIGVFYKANGSTTWLPFRNNLPVVPITDLVLYETNNIIRAGTFGRGVWQAPTANGTCDVNYMTISFIRGWYFAEASQTLTSNALIYGGYGTDVFFKAGNYIEFTEGFEAKDNGTLLKAYIAPCGTGIP